MKIRNIVEKILTGRRHTEPHPPFPIEDGKLLMDEDGAIRVNFDHPEVQAKILYQLKNYPRIPVKQPAK